jgi:hypothetical protein
LANGRERLKGKPKRHFRDLDLPNCASTLENLAIPSAHSFLASLRNFITMAYFKFFLVLLLSTLNVLVQSTGTKEFDYCGVDGEKFLDYNFTGNHNVAGLGCTLGNKTNCLCSIDYNDQSSLSPFIWQCGTVEFGPKGNKTCPATVPVVKPTGVNSIDFSESMLGVSVTCDTAVNPTGYPGDEACGYSECEKGGDYSAICGCVDFSQRDDVELKGVQWICLHSTCNCPEDGTVTGNKNSTTNNSTSAAASTLPLSFLAGFAVALVGAAL